MSSVPLSYLQRYRDGSLSDREFFAAGCLHPKKLRVKPSASIRFFDSFVDCGKCPNCIANRRNDWVSRMCLHSLYFKHCYFVTLTYGSFDSTLYDAHPFLKSWFETLPVLCDDNSKHSYRPTPSIIVPKHFSNFIKRLRLLIDDDISFCSCYEYGGEYGRPHAHFILWSNSIISKSDICSAWSLKCVYNSSTPRIVKSYRGQELKSGDKLFSFVIGRVKYYDLVANGTLDFSSVAPVQSQFSGPKCFNYVATYINKFNTLSIPSSALRRLQFVFNLLPSSTSLDFNEDTPPDVLSQYKSFYYNNVYYEKLSYFDFQQLVAPSFNFSRKYSIGKRYFVENFERFNKGNFTLPKFCGKTLSFPRYYFYLLSLEKQPFRLEKVSLLGRCYTKGDYKVLLSNLQEFRSSPNLFYASSCKKPLPLKSFYTDSRTGNIFHSIIFFDFVRYHIHYSPTFDIFEFYVFNTHTREYDFSFYEERVDFLDFLIRKIQSEIDHFSDSLYVNKLALDLERDKLLHDSLLQDEFYEKFAYHQHIYTVQHSKSDSQ